ncbi:MAG: polysaccharide deacetylase family protein [Flavobacteriales bacterium]|nr:polysaccharide deacetylase family protein [Flavobacteriales bacterium]
MLVYSHSITNRARYIFHVMLGDMLGLEVEFTNKRDEFISSDKPKISYTHSKLGDELHFRSTGLLHQKGVEDQSIRVLENEQGKYFYAHNSQDSELNFDVFAASFYLLSRYEECLPHLRDQYNRFEATESLAFKHGFLTEPVVDQWLLRVRDIIRRKYPELKFKNRQYKFVSTIDIDNAYAYKNKGFMRTAGAYARAILNGKLKEVIERTQVLLGRKKDPYDTYDFQLSTQKEFAIETIYFFLLADYGVNDKNVPYYNQEFQSLIKHLADYAQVGIHPGFNSNEKNDKLTVEKKRLEKIIHRSVTKSRQHFLILHIPHTYHKLIENDITEDYSMGYAAHVGFRAGTCTPFRFYDLDLETPTELTVYPFAMMEATLKYYMKLSPEESKTVVSDIVRKVKAVDGTFMSLWHNETLTDTNIWKGWRDVFLHMMREAKQ